MNTDFNDISTRFLRMCDTLNTYYAFGTGMREYAGLITIETPEYLANYHYFLTSFQKKLSQINYNTLSEKDKVEYLLLDNKLQRDSFYLVDRDSYHSDPTHYIAIAFIFEYLIKKYAPLNQRIEELSLHLSHFPNYYKQALQNLDIILRA